VSALPNVAATFSSAGVGRMLGLAGVLFVFTTAAIAVAATRRRALGRQGVVSEP
jgi:hypothetical protein